MFARPWQNNYPGTHWSQLPLHGAISNRDNREMTQLFSDKNLSETSSCLLDGCRVLSLFPSKARLKSVSLTVRLSRFNSAALFDGCCMQQGSLGLLWDFIEDCWVSWGLQTSTLNPQDLHSKPKSVPLWDPENTKSNAQVSPWLFFTPCRITNKRRSNSLEYLKLWKQTDV